MLGSTLRLLEADLSVQCGEISRVYDKVHQRMDGYEENEERREGLAFHLHNLYCAFEALFHMFAEAFENQLGEGPGWHVELLMRMREEIPGVRPNVIGEEDFERLNELRAFRHVFRHAYAAQLSPDKLAIVVNRALALEHKAPDWVAKFLVRCRAAE